MKKHFISLLSLIFIYGCTASSTPGFKIKEKYEPLPESQISTSKEAALKNIGQKDLRKMGLERGVVFAKTDFQGVLKTTYVRLSLAHQEDTTKAFQLTIADKSKESAFPWDVAPVEPGYFYIELPAGKYKIVSISIPVGSTLASEPVDIEFEVLPKTVVYLGTLKVIGTKERIKLGGIPVIKPGFEYTVEVSDEQKEALTTFRSRYPAIRLPIKLQLMKVNPLKEG